MNKISGISLDTFKTAIDHGFYYKKDNEILYAGNNWVFVGNSCAGYFIESHYIGDEKHCFDWNTDTHVSLSDYGKTWSLNRDDLLDPEIKEQINSNNEKIKELNTQIAKLVAENENLKQRG